MRKHRTYYVQMRPRHAQRGSTRHKQAGVEQVEARFAFEAVDRARNVDPMTKPWYVIGTAEELPEHEEG